MNITVSSLSNGVIMNITNVSPESERTLLGGVKNLLPENLEVRTITTVAVDPEQVFKAEELGIVQHDNKVMASSRKIAAIFGKPHKDVLRSIRRMECTLEFTRRNFALSSYEDSTGRSQPEYFMTKDGFMFLVMGFTGKLAAQFKEEYIDAFNAMEKYINSRLIQRR